MYSTLDDLKNTVPEDELIELTDDVGASAVDTSVVARAIADADAEIDSYCGSRYTMPLSPVPVIIRKFSVDMAIYNLFSRRSLKVPDDRQKRYDNAIRFLRDLAKGINTLGGDDPGEPTDSLPQATQAKENRIFSMGKAFRPSIGVSTGSVGTLDNY